MLGFKMKTGAHRRRKYIFVKRMTLKECKNAKYPFSLDYSEETLKQLKDT
jgi:hypothetical protein